MLEGNLYFRGVVDDGAPKLVEPKFAGPFDLTRKTSLFSSTTVTETLYCVSAGVKWPIVPAVQRTAVIRVVKAAEGERLQAKIGINYPPFECNRAEYKPFAEMEQLRAQRRRALGKDRLRTSICERRSRRIEWRPTNVIPVVDGFDPVVDGIVFRMMRIIAPSRRIAAENSGSRMSARTPRINRRV